MYQATLPIGVHEGHRSLTHQGHPMRTMKAELIGTRSSVRGRFDMCSGSTQLLNSINVYIISQTPSKAHCKDTLPPKFT